jgi:hypothetical protein
MLNLIIKIATKIYKSFVYPFLIKRSLFSRIWRILFDFHEIIDYEKLTSFWIFTKMRSVEKALYFLGCNNSDYFIGEEVVS